MATLQKIRNRGGVLVSIVIGLALVAFIVGDALSSGASLINRSRNKVGEVTVEVKLKVVYIGILQCEANAIIDGTSSKIKAEIDYEIKFEFEVSEIAEE